MSSMKIHNWTIQTKAFKARVRVQNGRIVDISPVLKQLRGGSFTKALSWLNSNFPDNVVNLDLDRARAKVK